MCFYSTHLLGMPSWVMCTTRHTSKTQPLLDMEILSIYHFHSCSFVISLWDRMEFQWAYILPFKMLQYFFDVFDLVDVKELFIVIPFQSHLQRKMQLPKVFHFKHLTPLFFDLQKFVLIVAHQNEVIHIDHNEKLDISHLYNIHTMIGLILHKFNAFEKHI